MEQQIASESIHELFPLPEKDFKDCQNVAQRLYKESILYQRNLTPEARREYYRTILISVCAERHEKLYEIAAHV